MSLILLCGLPASGKTTVATHLHTLLSTNHDNVHIISDFATSSSSPRQTLYQTSTSEKTTRSRLRSSLEHLLTPSSIIICDSLNYIKGFRYELYCIAKTTGVRYAVIYCNSTKEKCLQNDQNRLEKGQDAYGKELCNQLIYRFEEPNEKNRWDHPLFQVDISKSDWQNIVTEIKNFLLQDDNQLIPTIATRIPQKQATDIFGILDRTTREAEAVIISSIQSGSSIGSLIHLPNSNTPIRLQTKPKIAQIRHMRRAYLNLVRLHPPTQTNNENLIEEYIEYVNTQLAKNQ